MFIDCFAQFENIEQVCLANVAGEKAEAALASWVDIKKINDFFILKTTKECRGVINAYSDPSRHGVDRWAALLGARFSVEGEICVICAGTAVTVDFLDAAGVHLGGIIMPGLDMMRHALIKHTAGISIAGVSESTQDDNISDILAVNTKDALLAGTLNLLRAGVQDICEQAVDLLGDDVTIVLTGGLAERLLPLLKSSNIVYDPQLILKGLRLAADN